MWSSPCRRDRGAGGGLGSRMGISEAETWTNLVEVRNGGKQHDVDLARGIAGGFAIAGGGLVGSVG